MAETRFMAAHPTRQQERPDPAEAPAYTLQEAARYIKLPAATLRWWILGRTGGRGRFQPLIQPASVEPAQLSFANLVEAHVLRALRTTHDVPMRSVRRALEYAEHKLGIERLLLSEKLCTDGGRIFLDEYGKLIELSASGQLAMRKVFEEHLKRIDWGALHPVRLYPFLSNTADSAERPIAIDPQIAFGRPIIARTGVSTLAIADRIDAGETVEDLAADYGLEAAEIEDAVLYERAA